MKLLRILLLIGVAAALATGLSCSDDSPVDTDGGGNGGTGDDFDVASVEAALETVSAAETLYLAVMASHDMQAAADTALAFLSAQPTVDHASIGPDSTVWAFFSNGLLAGIYEWDRNPPGGFQADRVAEDIIDAKGGGEALGSAVILTPFAHEWGNTSELQVAEMLDDCFGSMEPATVVFSNNEVTVDKVKEVLTAGPGVLIWTSHGCVVPADASGYGWVVFMTGENYTSRQMAQRVVNNYSAGAKARGFNREIVVVRHKGKHYLAVTPTFVTSNGNFDYLEGSNYNGSKSVMFADLCWSGVWDGLMPDAFLTAGVDCYLGWTDAVYSGFASGLQVSFFENATDTFTIEEAINDIGNTTDPKSGATLVLHEYEPMMIRAQMTMKKDGGDQFGYSVGVVVDEVTIVSCFSGQPRQVPQNGVVVHIPGTGPGSWTCETDEDAVIAVTELMTGRLFIVQKDFVGVNGTIDVKTYDEDVISGTFSGTLGYWTLGQDPEEVPPAATTTILNGVFKHIGIRQ